MPDAVKLSSPATGEFWEIPVLFEDGHLLALNKPGRLLVSPDRSAPKRPSLMQLLHRDIERGAPWAAKRGFDYLINAHRLDFETSGVLLLARNKSALVALANQFAAEPPCRVYAALVRGSSGEDKFATLAKRYHVSRAVVLRRMLDEKRVSAPFYQAKSREWDAQKSAGGSGGNYHATQNAYLSERFLQEVFARYARRQISRDDVADFIDIKPRNVEKLQDLVLRGAAA